MARILVFGESGQLARAIKKLAGSTSHLFTFLSRLDCEFTQSPERLRAFLVRISDYDGVIIAAAYTDVDKAKRDYESAWKVNARAPAIIAEACAKADIPMVHISTDYVFSGMTDRPWRPEDKPAPINAYGQTKREGEVFILASKARAAIIRTSWVFDGLGKNFVTAILRGAKTRNELAVVGDQLGRPTYAGDLARASLTTLESYIKNSKNYAKIYHVTGSGRAVTWAEFAKTIMIKTENSRSHKVMVQAIASSEYKSSADRPAYSVMDISAFEVDHGYKLPDWEDGLNRALQQWKLAKEADL